MNISILRLISSARPERSQAGTREKLTSGAHSDAMSFGMQCRSRSFGAIKTDVFRKYGSMNFSEAATEITNYLLREKDFRYFMESSSRYEE